MRDTNRAESMDAEGLPDVEDSPPGIDIETAQEAMMAPRDHPVAAGQDPAYATTAAEERVGESVAERAARENPDFGAEELGIGGSVQGSRSVDAGLDPEQIDLPADDSAPSAEEAAVHIRSEDDI